MAVLIPGETVNSGGGGGGPETDPIFSASAAAGITSGDITTWDAALQPSDIGATVQAYDSNLTTFLANHDLPAAPINGTYLKTNNLGVISWGTAINTLTFTAPTGFSVTGSPVTLSTGTIALAFAAGYSLPTTAKQALWDVQTIQAAASDEVTPLTVGAAKLTFPRMPYAATLTRVLASVATAPTGANLVVDINLDGVSVLGNKLSIDAGEKTSVTAATPATIITSSLPNDGEITIDIDQVGATFAGTGLKVTLVISV